MALFTLLRFLTPNATVSVSEAAGDLSTTAAEGQAIENLDTYAARINGTNTGTSAMTLDMSAASDTTGLRAPNKAGAAPILAGTIALNTTSGLLEYGNGSATVIVAPASLALGTGTSMSNGTFFVGATMQVSATEASANTPVPNPVTYTKMYINLETAPGGGQTYAFTLRKNGVDQTITATVSGTAKTANDTAHSATFAAGDLIAVKVVGSAGAAAQGICQIVLAA